MLTNEKLTSEWEPIFFPPIFVSDSQISTKRCSFRPTPSEYANKIVSHCEQNILKYSWEIDYKYFNNIHKSMFKKNSLWHKSVSETIVHPVISFHKSRISIKIAHATYFQHFTTQICNTTKKLQKSIQQSPAHFVSRTSAWNCTFIWMENWKKK